jgi:single-stranded-DNA-specific exonuclease
VNQTTSRPDYFLGVEKSASGQAWLSRLDAARQATAVAISQRLGVHEQVARVMAGRNVGVDDAETFLNPALKTDMPDPASLTDMAAAVSRLADAVEAGQSVVIFGDYDVDGATSAALLSQFLSAYGVSCRIYIPDRIFEGYGPNPEAIEGLIDDGAQLIVTVDCGVTSFEALEAASRRSIDVVVIDHHQTGVELPEAAAIVNPNRQDDVSGQGHLAAVGVVFLTVVALNSELKRRGVAPEAGPVDLLRFLDLVALGTVCDVVPLTGVNRAFVIKGLIAIRHNQRPGMQALIETARLNGPCTAGQLGFMIGPRINAGGRIGDASLGSRLLTTEDPGEARQIAERLDQLNVERQAIEREAVADAVAEAEADIGGGEGPAVVVCARDNWHPGVVGLVASRLKDRFDRPAFAIALSEQTGLGVGSGRSIYGVDLGAAVRGAVDEDILVKGGGHAMAAGLTVERGKIGDLRAYLEDRLSEGVAERRRDRSLKIDGALMAPGANVELIEALEQAGPYGSGHPTPVFAFPAHRINYADIVGNGHIRCTLSADVGSNLKAIAFRAAETDLGRLLLQTRGEPLHVAGTLGIDYWGGTAKPQLRIIDAARPTGRF